MSLIPEFNLTWWNGFLVIVPLAILRYGFLACFGRQALRRAVFTPPLRGSEKFWLMIFIISLLFLILYLPFVSLKRGTLWFAAGALVYFIALLGYAYTMVDFGRPDLEGFSRKGMYGVSRNPMYLTHQACLLGGAIMMASWLCLLLVLINTISIHKIIPSEERWCLETNGEPYRQYMSQVKRYFGRGRAGSSP